MNVNERCMNELEIVGNKPKESLKLPLVFSTPVPKASLFCSTDCLGFLIHSS